MDITGNTVRKIGYARVANSEATADLQFQIDRLRAAGCDSVYSEVAPGSGERPELHRAIAALVEGDCLLAESWDRFSRNREQVYEMIRTARTRGVQIGVVGAFPVEEAEIRLAFELALDGIARQEIAQMLNRRKDGALRP